MTADSVGLKSEMLKDFQHGHADGANGRLGNICFSQRFFLKVSIFFVFIRKRIDMVGQTPGAFECFVSTLKNIQCIREKADQITAHVDILTPLAGEDKCHFSGWFRAAVKYIFKLPCFL